MHISFVAGLIAALFGVVLLMQHSLELSRQAFLGDLFGLITAGFYAGYQLSVKRLRAHWSAVTVMTWSSLCGAAALVLVCLVMRDPLIVPGMLWIGWGVLLAMALAGHVGGQGAIAYASAHLPASFSSVGLLVQPVVAAAVAWAWLGEAIGTSQYIGGAIVLFGVCLARRGSASAGAAGED